jgi:hypothetical protein
LRERTSTRTTARVLRSFRWTKAGGATDHWDWSSALNPKQKLAQIASFGEDEDGEVTSSG